MLDTELWITRRAGMGILGVTGKSTMTRYVESGLIATRMIGDLQLINRDDVEHVKRLRESSVIRRGRPRKENEPDRVIVSPTA